MKDFMNEQKMLSIEQMKEAFIYGVICTADMTFCKENSRGTEFLVINEIVKGVYNGHFSGYGRYTVNGSIITNFGGAKNVMFDVPCFREVYNISSLNEYEYSLKDIFEGKELDEVIDVVRMAFEFRNNDPSYISDLEVRNAIKGFQTFYDQGKCLKCWPNSVTIDKHYKELCAKKEKSFDDILSADSNSGLCRSRNDDASLIMQHPDFSDYKLMVVADGVGSCPRGDIASSMFCEKMHEWFNGLTRDDFKDDFKEVLGNAIKCADMEIADFNKNIGQENVTVASVAVIMPDNTYFSTVGDTRIYFELGDELKKVDRIENLHDKSLKYNAYEKGIIRDDGFNCERPEGYIGYGSDAFGLCDPVVNCISSDSYTGILMVSDGVYNEIDDNKLNLLFNKCLPEDIASIIVEQATYGYVKNSKYVNVCPGYQKAGRDNITAAVYKKVYEYDKDKVMNK